MEIYSLKKSLKINFSFYFINDIYIINIIKNLFNPWILRNK